MTEKNSYQRKKVLNTQAFGIVLFTILVLSACSKPTAQVEKPTSNTNFETVQPSLVPPTFTLAPSGIPAILTTSVPPTPPIPGTTNTLEPPTPNIRSTETPMGLSPDGPWAVFAMQDALEVSNPDGSGWTRLPVPGLENDPNLNPAPSGGWISFLSGSWDSPATLTLKLLHLPEGEIKTITPLLSETLRQAFEKDINFSSDMIMALTRADSQRWSPDGRFLAFSAALDGPSTDLYVYEISTETIRQLTSGPNQTTSLLWSDDSQWIVHSAVETFGSGAGWIVTAVWAASVDGKSVNKLFDTTPDSGGEIYATWYDSEQFMVYTWTALSPRQVRLVNVRTGSITILYPGQIGDAAMDPESQRVAIRIDPFSAGTDANLPGAGIYWIDPPGTAPQLALAGDWFYLGWEPYTRRFQVNTSGMVVLLDQDRQVVEFPERSNLEVAPDGQWIATCDLGFFGAKLGLALFKANGEQVWDNETVGCQEILWRPDGSGFFAWLDPTLVVLEIPENEMKVIVEDFSTNYLRASTWVKP